MQRASYPSDLSNEQWAVLEPLVCTAINGRTGRPPKYERREIVNALLYMARTGCSYRQLPHDLPPWGVVWEHFRRWREQGKLEKIHGVLREQVRQGLGRDAHPSAGILDSQSVKAPQKGTERGNDA